MRQKVLTISKRVIAYLTWRGYHYMMLGMRCLTLVACLFPVCFILCSAAIPVRVLSVIRGNPFKNNLSFLKFIDC